MSISIGLRNLLVIAIFVSATVAAAEVSAEAHQTKHGLGQLAQALASGKDAIRPLRGARSESSVYKDRLDPAIPGMECHIDRIASYVSCYSSLLTIAQADSLFSRLADELGAVLDVDKWKVIKKQAASAPLRSQSYAAVNSSARIDIDIISRPGLTGHNSYILSMYGWSH